MLGEESMGQIASHWFALSNHKYICQIPMKFFIKDFNNGISNHTVSVTLALSPLVWKNIDSRAEAETCHICMIYLAWMIRPFVEYGSNKPYNLPTVLCCYHDF